MLYSTVLAVDIPLRTIELSFSFDLVSILEVATILANYSSICCTQRMCQHTNHKAIGADLIDFFLKNHVPLKTKAITKDDIDIDVYIFL